MRTMIIEGVKYFSLSWNDVEKDVASLIKKIPARPTVIIGIARGGIVIARLLSDLLDVQKIRFFRLKSYESVGERKNKIEIYQQLKENLKKDDVLLVDDIADTGKSLEVCKQLILSLRPRDLKTATPYLKPWSNFKPDYFVKTFDDGLFFRGKRMSLLGKYQKNIVKRK
jgi:hypoxanthine phosphoribosyltransferase